MVLRKDRENTAIHHRGEAVSCFSSVPTQPVPVLQVDSRALVCTNLPPCGEDAVNQQALLRDRRQQLLHRAFYRCEQRGNLAAIVEKASTLTDNRL
jgi:hypothetical protein